MFINYYKSTVVTSMWLQVDEQNIVLIAQEIRRKLKKNLILSISGELGVGKTTLIKHILHDYAVTSPSFLHMLLYGEEFAHIDAYTFKSTEEFLALGIEELLESRCVIIEWGELVADLFDIFEAKVLTIKMKYNGNKRFVLIED